jgi:four helix bundle protein
MRDIRERAFEFACRIVRLHRAVARHGTARRLADQVLRSGTSIGANLEEAQGGHSKRDFIAKCRISLKEARETLFWLRLFAATDLVQANRITALMSEANELVAILTTIVKNASRS